MENNIQNILIAGGSGVTGRLIIKYLTDSKLPIKIDIASRKASEAQGLSDKIGKINIDFNNIKKTSLLFQQYDIIILAIGPFDIFKATLHKICISEHKICIDINDSFKASTEILKLNKEAKDNGSMILTGMGLAPGLTTLLLLDVLENDDKIAKNGGVRMFFSNGINSGKASIYTMLINFISHVYILRNGKKNRILSKEIENNSFYNFNKSLQNKPLIYYSSPEVQTISNNKNYSNIQQIDFAFHLEGMPMKMIPFLRGLKIFRKKIITYLCNSIYKKQNSQSSNNNIKTQIIASAFGEYDNYIKRSYVNSSSSYKLTALTASLITEMVLENKIPNSYGVFSMDSEIISKQILKSKFEKRGIEISSEIVK